VTGLLTGTHRATDPAGRPTANAPHAADVARARGKAVVLPDSLLHPREEFFIDDGWDIRSVAPGAHRMFLLNGNIPGILGVPGTLLPRLPECAYHRHTFLGE